MEAVYEKFSNTPHDRLQEIVNELCKTGKLPYVQLKKEE